MENVKQPGPQPSPVDRKEPQQKPRSSVSPPPLLSSSPCASPALPPPSPSHVLTERNIDSKCHGCNNNNKLVSPVLLKLRRNQERKVIPANPVDPVKVPPKKLTGFPTDRYMSPTDSLMSPISRGLLARGRRPFRSHQAPVPPKILDSTFESAESVDP